MGSAKVWTTSEMQFICNNYHNMSDAMLAAQLDRTENSVRTRRAKNGLFRSSEDHKKPAIVPAGYRGKPIDNGITDELKDKVRTMQIQQAGRRR